jgi:hypothetical protein
LMVAAVCIEVEAFFKVAVGVEKTSTVAVD